MDKLNKKLLKLQQMELDAAVLYRELSDKLESERERAVFDALAAEEGHHASVLRHSTQLIKRPRHHLKRFAILYLQLFGRKALYKMIVKVEKMGANKYSALSLPEARQIADDEARHARIVLDLLN